MESNINYYAFLSYSRKDIDAARFLQHSLEHFRYERKLVTPENCPKDKKYLRPIFWDKTDLNVTKHNFSNDLKQSLQQSKYLIVLCSKNAVVSEYVTEEINYFLETHNNDTSLVIPVLLDNNVKDVLPTQLNTSEFWSRNLPSMTNETDEMFNKVYWENGVQQCISYLLDIPFPVIARRFQKEKSRAIKITLGWTIAIAVLLAVSTLFAVRAMQKAEESEKTAQDLANFEESVFPQSLVYGFVDNFLIYVLRAKPEANVILILPKDYGELEHFDRIENYKKFLTQKGFELLEEEIPVTVGQRSRKAFKLQPINNVVLEDIVFIDFVTTVTAFKGVIDYKKKGNGAKFYQDITENEMAIKYSQRFEKQVRDYIEEGTNDLVFSQKEQLKFVRTIEELNKELDFIIKQQ